MPDEFVDFQTRGLEGVQKMVGQFARSYQGVAMMAAAEYLVGNESHGLKHYPAYRYVSRMSAYGQAFFSDRQRRWFFWAKAQGIINPGQDNRTGAIRDGWEIKKQGATVRIHNQAAGVRHVMGYNQARQPAKAGWLPYYKIAANNAAGMARAAAQAVQRLVKSLINK